LTGVSNKIPVVEAYGEADVKLNATADLFSGISLLTDLMKTQRDKFNYLLDLKLDVGGFHPNIRVKKEGNISITPDR